MTSTGMERGKQMPETYGKGTFRKTKSGGIEYRFPYRDIMGKRRIKSFTGSSKKECIKRADEFLKKHQMDLIEINANSTIAEIAEQKAYSDFRKNYLGEGGYDRRLSRIAIIRNSDLGETPISDVTCEMLRDFLDSIIHYSNSSIRGIHRILRESYILAHKRGLIDENLMERPELKRPMSDKDDKVVRGMTEDEQKRFVQALEEHKVPYGRNGYKNQLLLELYTGMRMGEINALKPEDIDFKRGLIHIKATIARGIHSVDYYKKHPKSDAGVRDVPISAKAEVVLRQALSEMQYNKLGLVFYDYNKDDVVATHQVAAFYRRLCIKTGIPNYGQHALRHTFATRCIEADVPPMVLKKWLGHTNIHITLDTYADVFERMHNAAIERFDEYIDCIKETTFTYTGGAA